jgi:hypothetical protein
VGEKLPNFIKFLRWWDPANLQASDFEKFTPEGGDKQFDSRVEHVIRAIHKTADTDPDKANIKWAADFVGEYLEKCPDNEWFPYYYGQLLVKTGDLEHAREMILPIVRQKQEEFWAWHSLAATFPDSETEKRLACLCKSLECYAKDESFLVNVHTELGHLLVQQSNYPAAKFEIAKAIAIRQSKNWKISQSLLDLQASAWFAQTQANDSNASLYKQHSPEAEKILFSGLPRLSGLLMHQLPQTDEKPGLCFIGYAKDRKLHEVSVKTKHFDWLRDAKSGTPLVVQLDDSTDPAVVVMIEPRPGTPWDILPDYIGIVRHVNTEKSVTSVVFGKEEFCLFHHDRFPEAAALLPGQFVAAKLRRDVKHDKVVPLACSVTDKAPSTDFCRTFQGLLERNPDRPFGFVNHEVFVPEIGRAHV